MEGADLSLGAVEMMGLPSGADKASKVDPFLSQLSLSLTKDLLQLRLLDHRRTWLCARFERCSRDLNNESAQPTAADAWKQEKPNLAPQSQARLISLSQLKSLFHPRCFNLQAGQAQPGATDRT